MWSFRRCLNTLSGYPVKNWICHHVRDTIFALSSGHGKCGVAVIRTSGPASQKTLHLLTKWQTLPPPRQVKLASILCPKSGELLDRGLVVWFSGPHSFTGEDCCEYHVHGGLAVVRGVLQALGSLQMLRPAEPGEFTKRAFQNGKLDLTEVEGLGDLIHAETEVQRRQALRQMSGELGQLYHRWSQQLIRGLAHIEAFIDFSEDDNVEEDVLLAVDEVVDKLQKELEEHLKDNRRGERLRDGVQVVLTGATNAGKSSLLNVISQKPTAIVSSIPGTTRDVVETTLNIGGYPIILSDTAGLRDSEDPIEKEGVRRAKARVREADILVAVIDVCNGLLSRETLLAQLQNIYSSFQGDGPRNVILALNKVDLLSQESIVYLEKLCQESGLLPVCLLSCHTGEGISKFLGILRDHLEAICGDPLQGMPTITQTRHRHHLMACLGALGRYSVHRQQDLVLSAEELRIAHRQLGAITGRVSAEEILDIIFSDFCIGK
ncbi:tRNA modification GTPase GTPBP3, mitochondrial [Hyla sarda]|uniref:tRNA modification GTPase GTPBP3, mitochondrial n=1 Tax=Hyla sarda TaxID=327740 RepID=UPI0024C2858D|nr:tRNA modification GTPase GTPBP3, mitochondrial [Hyla sarda]XP_056374198.1 tRNA modification GTPase GTPBP3, mitochondrial [Hyla sarda]XP_056374199.1 tRNA modification GTPase GTPBP3, mitochondrial [Hyla sarda]XP_056374200.1 tRNA modification GTPase GTPBP3, mitochondrial [Hyla sarda]